MSSALDYVGRRVDVLAFQPPPSGSGLDGQSLVDPMSQVCAGAQKVAQRWALCFLTPLGSAPYRPAYGAEFVGHMASGDIQTEADVVRYFHESALLVDRQVQAAEEATDPADERLAGSALIGATIAADGVTLNVSVTTRAGTTRPVLLPISTVP